MNRCDGRRFLDFASQRYPSVRQLHSLTERLHGVRTESTRRRRGGLERRVELDRNRVQNAYDISIRGNNSL